MADSEKYNKKPSSSSFFSSPRLFTNFTPKGSHETETMMSPTSTLDSKPFSGFKNPFWSETNSPRTPGSEHKRYWDKLDSKGVGLGLVDALVDEDKHGGEVSSKSESRMVLFGSQLKIQIPPLSPSESSKFVAEKGKCASGVADANNSQRVFVGCLSASEMELSEDYTRVISRGPNPRTTHIFDNCIIESSCFELGCSASSAKENGCFLTLGAFSVSAFTARKILARVKISTCTGVREHFAAMNAGTKGCCWRKR